MSIRDLLPKIDEVDYSLHSKNFKWTKVYFTKDVKLDYSLLLKNIKVNYGLLSKMLKVDCSLLSKIPT